MNKKYLMFGMFGLFAMALVSAGLVTYLSNTTNVNVGVESPLLLVSSDSDMDVYGGVNYAIESSLESRIADNVNGIFTMTIDNDLGNAACSDFDTIVVTEDGTEITAECSDDENTIITFLTTNIDHSNVAYIVDLKFAQDVEPTAYTVSSVVNIPAA